MTAVDQAPSSSIGRRWLPASQYGAAAVLVIVAVFRLGVFSGLRAQGIVQLKLAGGQSRGFDSYFITYVAGVLAPLVPAALFIISGVGFMRGARWRWIALAAAAIGVVVALLVQPDFDALWPWPATP